MDFAASAACPRKNELAANSRFLNVISHLAVSRFRSRRLRRLSFPEKNSVLAALVAGRLLFFYGWWNPLYLLLIVYSTLLDYVVVILMERRSRKLVWLVISIVNNLFLLGFFKYAEFITENANLTGAVLTNANLAKAFSEPTGDPRNRIGRRVPLARCLRLDREQSIRGGQALSTSDRRSFPRRHKSGGAKSGAARARLPPQRLARATRRA